MMKKGLVVLTLVMIISLCCSCKKVDASKQTAKAINNGPSIDRERKTEEVTTKAKEATSKTVNESSQEATTKSEVNTSATIITSIEATEAATMAPTEKEAEIYTEAQTQPYIEPTQPYIEPTQPQIQVVTEEPTTQVVVIVQPEPQTEAQTQAAELTWALSYDERLQAFIDGVNDERAHFGLSTFTMADLNPDAMNYAQSWAEQMAAMGKHTHGTGDQSFDSRSTVFCRTYGYPGIAEGVDSDVIDHILGKSISEYNELFGEGRLLCEHIGGSTNARWTYLGIGMAEGYKISPISGTPYKAIFYCFVAI